MKQLDSVGSVSITNRSAPPPSCCKRFFTYRVLVLLYCITVNVGALIGCLSTRVLYVSDLCDSTCTFDNYCDGINQPKDDTSNVHSRLPTDVFGVILFIFGGLNVLITVSLAVWRYCGLTYRRQFERSEFWDRLNGLHIFCFSGFFCICAYIFIAESDIDQCVCNVNFLCYPDTVNNTPADDDAARVTDDLYGPLLFYFSIVWIGVEILSLFVMHFCLCKKSSVAVSTELTDCFLTHDWGKDEHDRNNHARVSKVNAALKKRGINTWFDEERMEGSVRRMMAEGIENTKVVIVFVTDRYRNKVNGTDDRDNCRYEFTYAVDQKGPQNMLAVVMEPRMYDAKQWKGELGAAMGGKLYIGLTSDDPKEFEDGCNQLYDQLKIKLDGVNAKV